MTPEEIPDNYRRILNQAVGKNFSIYDAEMVALARILTEHGDDDPAVSTEDLPPLNWPDEDSWCVAVYHPQLREWNVYENECTTQYDAGRLVQVGKTNHPNAHFRVVRFHSTAEIVEH